MRTENPAIWRPPATKTIICPPPHKQHEHDTQDQRLDDMHTMIEDIHTITTTRRAP